jgi:hypothetical protein
VRESEREREREREEEEEEEKKEKAHRRHNKKSSSSSSSVRNHANLSPGKADEESVSAIAPLVNLGPGYTRRTLLITNLIKQAKPSVRQGSPDIAIKPSSRST